MLYRVMTSCPAVKDGLLFAFVDLGPDDADEVPHAKVAADAEARFALTYGVPLEGVWDIKSALQLETDGVGPADLPAYRWFEYGMQGGQPTYITQDEAVYLLDDQTTSVMLAHALNAATSPHLTAMQIGGPDEDGQDPEPTLSHGGLQWLAMGVWRGARERSFGFDRRFMRAIQRVRIRRELSERKFIARELWGISIPERPSLGYGTAAARRLALWAAAVDAALSQSDARLALAQALPESYWA